jgi:hypothetical protein
MHPPQIRAEALALVETGLNDCEISRRLSIPRRTILDWRRPTYVPRGGSPWNGDVCPRCWRAAKRIRFTPEDYSELLGLYLGDGCISAGARTMRLRITLDLKYPQIISDAQDLLARSLPSVGSVSRRGNGGSSRQPRTLCYAGLFGQTDVYL